MSETVWIAGDGRSNYPYARAAVVAREPGEDGAVTVQPADGSPAVAIPAAAAHRANPLGQRADNCELLYLNEACVLANIAERYEQKAIYTWTSRVLVSVNPYEELKIYGERELGSTPGLGLRELHVSEALDFALDEAAAESLVATFDLTAGRCRRGCFCALFIGLIFIREHKEWVLEVCT